MSKSSHKAFVFVGANKFRNGEYSEQKNKNYLKVDLVSSS
jgi:hypothetical protein